GSVAKIPLASTQLLYQTTAEQDSRCGKIADNIITGVPLSHKIRNDRLATNSELKLIIKAMLWNGRVVFLRKLLGEPVSIRWDAAAMKLIEPAQAIVMEMGGNNTGNAAM